jgi:hypothetical protein
MAGMLKSIPAIFFLADCLTYKVMRWENRCNPELETKQCNASGMEL